MMSDLSTLQSKLKNIRDSGYELHPAYIQIVQDIIDYREPEFKYYSVDQVAKMIAVSKHSVIAWIRNRKITGVIKLDNAYRIPHDQLVKFVEERFFS